MLKHAARLATRCATSASSNSASASSRTADSVCSTSGRTHQAAACTWQLQSWRWHGSSNATSSETISVTFYDGKDNSEKTVQVPLGQSLLEAAHSNDIDLEGACEGSLACSTCHVIVEDQEKFDLLPEADDDENDMLDLAFALTDTSRLGCQIIAAPELDGLKVRIPSATRNFAVDGYVPKPH